MANTVKGFYKEVKKELIKETIGRGSDYDKFLRTLLLRVFDLIVKRTPVDTGRARASWRITIGGTPTDEIASELSSNELSNHREKNKNSIIKDPHSRYVAEITQTTNEGNRIIGTLDLSKDDHIFISNNLPYIIYLEGGVPPDYSGSPISVQAPSGMLRISLQEVLTWAQTQSIVKKVIF